MNTDDPRHGTTAGYHAGCHEACCRAAMARYEKAGRLARLRGGRTVPVLGAQRRVQALMRLGWTSSDIAEAAGWSHRNYVLRILNGQKGKPAVYLERPTYDTLCATYERLCMTIPERLPHRARTATMAAQKGWPPPLAWDNIDDSAEKPKVGYKPRETSTARAADLEHLAHMGDNLETACAQLGLDRDTLWVWCKRNGHRDLYERLAERSRRQENQYTSKGAAA